MSRRSKVGPKYFCSIVFNNFHNNIKPLNSKYSTMFLSLSCNIEHKEIKAAYCLSGSFLCKHDRRRGIPLLERILS